MGKEQSSAYFLSFLFMNNCSMAVKGGMDVRRVNLCSLPPQGFNLTVGGGLGRTHRNEDTFPRLADPIGYVDKDDIFHAVSTAGKPRGRQASTSQYSSW